MTIAEVLSMDFTGKNVLIIGSPASGKTWLSNAIKTNSHYIVHTDDYICYGYEVGMYAALDTVIASKHNTIVEGVLCYRMLRKGVENNSYYPDVVIELKVSDARMEQTYKNERDIKKLKSIKSFNERHDKIIAEYSDACPNNKKPEWVTVFNNY
jgi:hypothetical protein